MSETTNVYQRMLAAQKEIKAPRQKGGRFGTARSAEQILESIKPICQKNGLLVHTTDSISEVGGRNYITATARVINVANPDEIIEATAVGWENVVSAGLDTAQVSGKTSSYAKKYALQNLFAIDDTKDADFEHTDPADEDDPADYAVAPPVNKPTPAQADRIVQLAQELKYTDEEIKEKLAAVQTEAMATAVINKLAKMAFEKDM